MSCKHGNWDCEICAEIDEAYRQGMLDEREACAKICDDLSIKVYDHAKGPYLKVSAAIRSRGDSECK